MTRRIVASVLVPIVCAAIVCAGCKCGSDSSKSKASIASAAPRAASAKAAAAKDLGDLPVPTEEDFEEAAERDITKDNFEAELDRLEKEIGE